MRASLPSLALLVVLGCGSGPRPLVAQDRAPPPRAALARVAIVPFVSGPALYATNEDAGAADVTRRVQAAVYGALVARGVDVLPAGELEAALAGTTRPGPAQLAALAAERLEASSILEGTVHRYVRRSGGEPSISTPASVAFELTLREARTGRKLWTGRFDETQHELTTRPLEASRLPGSGLRWVTAEELVRFGAQETVRTLLGLPR